MFLRFVWIGFEIGQTVSGEQKPEQERLPYRCSPAPGMATQQSGTVQTPSLCSEAQTAQDSACQMCMFCPSALASGQIHSALVTFQEPGPTTHLSCGQLT